MVTTAIHLSLGVLSIIGGVLGYARSWLGWPVYMCAQTALGIWMLALGEYAWAAACVLLMWIYTYGWLKILSARIVDDGILVEVDE